MKSSLIVMESSLKISYSSFRSGKSNQVARSNMTMETLTTFRLISFRENRVELFQGCYIAVLGDEFDWAFWSFPFGHVFFIAMS